MTDVKSKYYAYVSDLYTKNEHTLIKGKSLSELYIQRYYYKSKYEYGDIEMLLEEFSIDGDSGILWILGDLGQGKTSLCIKAVVDYVNSGHYQLTSGVFWFRLRLQNIPVLGKNQNPSMGMGFRWEHLVFDTGEIIELADIKDGFVFLDGFDELKPSLEKYNISDKQFFFNIYELAKEYRLHIVITSRPHALEWKQQCSDEILKNGKSESPYNFGGGDSLNNSVILLAPLTDRQQTEWVEKYLKLNKNEDNLELENYIQKQFQRLQENEVISVFLGVPLLLQLIVESRFVVSSGNITELYRYLFDITVGHLAKHDYQKEYLQKTYQKMAFKMFVHNGDFIELDKAEVAENTDGDAYLAQIFLSTSKVESAARKKDTFQVAFYHRSFYAYFLSEFFAEKLIAVKNTKSGEEFLEYLWPRRVDEDVLNFLRGMNELSDIEYDWIFSAIESTNCYTKNDSNSERDVLLDESQKRNNVFWNAITIINCIIKSSIEYPMKIVELLSELNADGIYLKNAILRDIDLSKANLNRADLSDADLSKTILRYADLKSVNLSNGKLCSAKIEYANLNLANLSQSDISSASLKLANLKSANLSAARLNETYLYRVNMSEASLNSSDLSGADLRYSDLSSTDLRYANLQGADLRNANLNAADIRKANLENALFSGADLQAATISKEQYIYLQKQDVGNLDKAIVVNEKDLINHTYLPKPDNHATFEELCMDIIKMKYDVELCYSLKNDPGNDFTFEKNARRYAIQCKMYNAGSNVVRLLKNTISKIEEVYNSEFDTCIFMTTLDSMKYYQETIRSLRSSKFEVQIWFWEDLEKIICSNENLINKYYPNLEDFLGGCYLNYTDCIEENRKKKIEILLPEDISRAYHVIRNKNYSLIFPDGSSTLLTALGTQYRADYANTLVETAHLEDELLVDTWIKNHHLDNSEYIYLEFYGNNRIFLKHRNNEDIMANTKKNARRFEETSTVSGPFINSVVKSFDGFRLLSLKIIDKGFEYCDFKLISNDSNMFTPDLFSTAIIGNNGAGKSYILKFISELFYAISTMSPESQIDLDKDQYEISYILKRHIYHISVRSGNAVFRKDNLPFYPTKDEIINILPNSIIALSFTLDDKFKYITKEERKSEVYKYLGVRHTDCYDIQPYVINAINENLVQLARKRCLTKFIKGISDFLKFEPILCYNYSVPIAEDSARVVDELNSEDSSNRNFPYSDFSYSDLRNVDFSGCILTGANFEGSNLENVNLSYSNLEEANFFKANLRNANLSNVLLRHADLRKAILADAYFRDASLEGADLSDTDCFKAYFKDADFTLANLENTNLEKALLFGNNNIEAAYIKNIRLPKDYVLQEEIIRRHPDSYKPVAHRYSFSKADRIQKKIGQINDNHQVSYNNNGIFTIFYNVNKEQIDEKLLLTKNYLFEHNVKDASFVFVKNGLKYYLTELSSGELQILYTMSCLATNITNYALILLDEPDLSLHPSWQISYLSFIKSFFKDYTGCHLILATHSHYIISDLDPSTSSLVTITREFNKRIIEVVDYSTYAWSAENILYNVFKVRTARNYYFQKDLERLMYLIGINSQKEDDIDEIRNLINKLDDFKYDSADPLNLILDQAKGYIKNV